MQITIFYRTSGDELFARELDHPEPLPENFYVIELSQAEPLTHAMAEDGRLPTYDTFKRRFTRIPGTTCYEES